jgi:hypothetical protein
MERDSSKPTEGKPLRIETVRGEPYFVAGRTLVPEVRVVSFARARATIGNEQLGGWGGGLLQATPRAIIEQTEDGERRIALTDSTSRSVLAMAAAGAAMVLFFTLVRSAARAVRRGQGCCAPR